MKRLLIAILIVGLWCGGAWGATYYANPGDSIANKTSNLQEGDILIINAGNYSEQNQMVINVPTVTVKANGIANINSSYNGTCLQIGDDKHHVTIDGISINKFGNGGNIIQTNAPDTTIQNSSLSFASGVSGNDGIKGTTRYLQRLTVIDSLISNSPEQGIDIIGGSNHIIKGNIFENCSNSLSAKGGVDGTTIENNISKDTIYQHFTIGGSVSQYVWDEYGPYKYQASNINVYGNICIDSGTPQECFLIEGGGNINIQYNHAYSGGVVIRPQVIYLNSTMATPNNNIIIKNNSFTKTAAGPAILSMPTISNLTISDNYYYSLVGGTHFKIDSTWYGFDGYKAVMPGDNSKWFLWEID